MLSTGYISGEMMKRVQISSLFSSRLQMMSLGTVTVLVKSFSLFDLFEVTMGQPHLQISFAVGASLRKFPHQACRASFDARFTD
jgi:hypothetical protein